MHTPKEDLEVIIRLEKERQERQERRNEVPASREEVAQFLREMRALTADTSNV